jgi:hypothetical protein
MRVDRNGRCVDDAKSAGLAVGVDVLGRQLRMRCAACQALEPLDPKRAPAVRSGEV